MKRFAIVAALALTGVTACQRDTEPGRIPPQQQGAATADAMAPSRPMAAMPTELTAEQKAVEHAPAQLCNLEGAGDVAFAGSEVSASAQAPVLFRGWVGVDATKTPPAQAALRFEVLEDKSRVWEVPIKVDQQRDDVASSQGADTLKLSGFAAPVSLSTLSRGRYHVLLAYEHEGKNYTCDNGRVISI